MAHKFIIDDRTGQLYSDFSGRRITTAAEILKAERGLSPTIEVYSVNVATDSRAVTAQTITNGNLSLSIGQAGKAPDKGLIKAAWTVSGTTYESAHLKLEGLTADALASAFNSAVYPVYNAGGLNVDQIGAGKYLLTMNKAGAISGTPGLDVESCDPPSAVEVNTVIAGDSDTKAQYILSLAQSPVAQITSGSWSSATSGSYSGLSASISLNTTAMLASISRGERDFEISIVHSGQVLHRSGVTINESLDPTSAGALVITSPNLFTLGSTAVKQGETIAISGGLTYDGTTLAAPFLPLAGGTMTGDALFGDNIKAKFGTGSDLLVWHDSSNSFIQDVGQGALYIEGSSINLRKYNSAEYFARFISDGAASLFYNGASKLETTDTGATISGKLIVNGDLDVSGSTTQFESTVVSVQDPIFTVGGSSAPESSDNMDRGIEFRYFRSGESAKIGFFGYSNADDAYKLLTSATNSSEVFSGTAGNLNVGNVLHGDGSAAAPSISFSDSDTGLFSVAADQLGFSTGGVERLHLYDDGFDFNNLSVNFKDSGGDGRATMGLASQHFNINVYGISGWINNAINIDNDTGHVGINNDSPAQKLDVKGRVRSSYNSGDYFEMGSSDSGGFLIGKSGDTEVVNVRTYGDSYFNGGNFGIGTSSIDYPLVVSGSATASGGSRWLQKIVDTTSMAAGVGGGLVFAGQTGSTTGERWLGSIHGAKTNGTDNDYGGDLVFNTRVNGGGLVEAARLNCTGLGIGGTASKKLHVKDGSSGFSGSFNARTQAIIESDNTTGTALTILNPSSGNGAIYFGDNTSEYSGQIIYTHTGDVMKFLTSATERMRIDSSGNVGISTTTPRNRLDLGANGTSHLRWGTWSELGEESSHNTLVLGNNVFVDSTATKVRATSSDGYRAIRMKYDQGITFHSVQQSVTANDTVAHERMRIDSSGNVGIGTTSPVVELDLHGDLMITNTAPRLILKESGSSKDMCLKVQTNGRLDILDDNQVNILATVLQSGNVGIGTSGVAIDQKLHVKGDAIRLEESVGSRHLDIIPAVSGSSHRFTSDSTGSGYQFENNVGALALLKGDGDLELYTDDKGLILSSANGTRYKITVANDGTVTSTAV